MDGNEAAPAFHSQTAFCFFGDLQAVFILEGFLRLGDDLFRGLLKCVSNEICALINAFQTVTTSDFTKL